METITTDTTSLSSIERIDRDQLVREARAFQAEIGRNEADFGRHLRDLNERKLYRENGKSWPVFAEEEFGLCSTSAYDYITMARICDDLIRAGREPLTVKSHAIVVASLETAELRTEAVEHARKVAAGRGRRLTSEILKQACEAVAISLVGHLSWLLP